MMLRSMIQTGLMLAVFAAILFGAAGSWRWPAAWVFLVGMGALSFGMSLWLLRRDPDLLRARLNSPFAGNRTRMDQALILAIGLGFLAWLAVMGLDRRQGWSTVPIVVAAAFATFGAMLVLASYAGIGWTFAANSFAAPQIRIQSERSQTTITTGPYRLVRHPMYGFAGLYLAGVALLLGSWVGLVGGVVLTASFGLRAAREEAMLRAGLDGYEDYARRVRWRLLPGVW